jgi:iron(III) transport system permease protein
MTVPNLKETYSQHLLRRSWNSWTLLVMAIALLILTPLLVVLSSVLTDAEAIWQHLLTTVLPEYIASSLWLMLGVGSCTAVIGVSAAWLVSMCRFPGRRLLEWALLLPMAAPAYVLAYVYTEMLEFYGPVQSALRAIFGWTSVQDYWFPAIRSMGGAIVVISLVLYPYVYLLARVAFLEQSVCTLEASRLLGCSPWKSFSRVALPLARPAIIAGLALVLMETLNDFGTVQYFAVNTFSVGIYRTWFGMGERIAASQLSALLLVFVLLLIGLERWSRQQTQYYQTGRYQRASGFRLKGWRAIAALIFCLLPIAFGFLIPAGRLLYLALSDLNHGFNSRFGELSLHSLILATVTAAIAIIVSLIMAYGLRLFPTWAMQVAVRTASVGYAIPGAVIAVGVLFPIGALDNAIDAKMRSMFGISTGLLFSGTITALVFAYLVRFLAVSYNTIESSLNRIKPNLDDAARSLGSNSTRTLLKIHAPLIRSGLLTAAILVFVDVMKELPATLIVRPFNFDTLAVEVYRLAADERLAEAAVPALAIVAVGILPVMILSRQITRIRVEKRT